MSAVPLPHVQPQRRSASALTALVPYLYLYKWQICIALGALLGASASLLAVPFFVGRLVDRFAATVGGGFSPGSLSWWLLLLLALYAACTALRAYVVNWVGDRVVTDLRTRIYDHLLSLPHRFFETRSTGELLSRISNDITALQAVISIVLVIGLRSVVQLAGALAMMVLADWQLSLVAVAVSPFIAGVAKLLGSRIRARSAINRDREAQIVMQLEESLNGIDTVKAFTIEDQERGRFRRQAELCFESAEQLIRARAEILLAVASLLIVAFAIGGMVALEQLAAAKMTGGALAQFVLYASVAGFAVLGLGDIHGEIRKAVGATERLFGVLDEAAEDARAPSVPKLPEGRGAVDFVAVSFSYPARPHARALKDVGLSVAAGEMVALTGPSGAGKTTLFRLLLRFHLPQRGTVSLDGVDVSLLDAVALRKEIAIVPQEPLIFSGSALDNIRIGRPTAAQAEVIEAAQIAQAHGFLSSLPAGYDTPLGHKGHQLSSGQRQRVAIARAVLRQPRLMLLDEASSFLDVESEARLREGLLPFLRARTTILISHRPSLVRHADRVVVLDRGRIAAIGTHATLSQSNPFYCSLMEHQ